MNREIVYKARRLRWQCVLNDCIYEMTILLRYYLYNVHHKNLLQSRMMTSTTRQDITTHSRTISQSTYKHIQYTSYNVLLLLSTQFKQARVRGAVVAGGEHELWDCIWKKQWMVIAWFFWNRIPNHWSCELESFATNGLGGKRNV